MKTKNFYKNYTKEERFPLLFDLDGNKAFLDHTVLENSKPYKEYQYENYFWPEVSQFECIDFAESETKLKLNKKQNSTIDELYKAANNRDYHVFNSLIENVNLSKFQADEIIKMIDLCISLDMIALAFDLATKAKELYSQHEKIESAFRALSPPKIIGIRPPQTKGVEKSQKWFRENASHHKGKWVAINDGRLLAEADSLKELKTKIDEKYMNPSTVIEKILP